MINNYSIIIPAYNEAESLGSLLNDLSKLAGCEQIIVVNDGSTDSTKDVVKGEIVKLINHEENRGYGASLKTGILAAKTDYIITCDADGQHTSIGLKKIIEGLEGFDMFIGKRNKQFMQVLKRKPGKKILHWFVNLLSEKDVPDFNSGMRGFKTNTIKKYLHLMPDGFSFSTTSTVAFNRMKYKVGYTEIDVHPRKFGKSSVNILADGSKTFLLILNLTVLFAPLKVFIPASAMMILSSILYFIIYAIMHRIHITSSMTLIFITGILIFFLGIVCEQVSAIRRELNE